MYGGKNHYHRRRERHQLAAALHSAQQSAQIDTFFVSIDQAWYGTKIANLNRLNVTGEFGRRIGAGRET
jgi:hypothetical protein